MYPTGRIAALPILVTTSHSGRAVPYDVLVEMLGEGAGDPDLVAERLAALYRQNDPFTDQIFHLPGAANVHAVVSRFVVDLNRDRDDLGANGVVKRTDFDLTPLYPVGVHLDEAAVEERLRRHWDPYHATVARLAPHASLYLDGHAMTAQGPALGPDAGAARPAFCLMNAGDDAGEAVGDRPTTLAPELARTARDLLWRHAGDLIRQEERVPNEILLNRPFATGGLLSAYGGATGVPALGIEIHRALYLDDDRPTLTPRLDRIGQLGHALRSFAADLLAALG